MSSPLGNYELLSKRFTGVVPSSEDISNFILLNSKPIPSSAKGAKKDSKPSWMSRLFDILSRGNYAAAEYVRGSSTNEFGPIDPKTLLGVIKGLTGENKTTFSNVLKEDFGMGDSLSTSGLALGLDIFADPTTYIPVAGILNKAKSLKGSKEVAAEIPLGEKLLRNGEAAFPENFGLPAREVGIPEALKAKSSSTLPLRDSLEQLKPDKVKYAEGSLPGSKEGEFPLPGLEMFAPSKNKKSSGATDAASKSKEVSGQIPIPLKDFKVTEIRKNTASEIAAKAAVSEPEAIEKILPVAKPEVSSRFDRMAEEVLSKWDPSVGKSEFSKKYPDSVNAPQQVKLFYRSIEQAKKLFKNPNSPTNKSKILSNAYKIFLAAEKRLETQGYVARTGAGENVKLSDVIEKLGGTRSIQRVLDEFVDPKPGSDVWKTVEGLRAGSAISDTPIVAEVIQKIAESKAITTNNSTLTDAQHFDFDKFLKSFGKASVQAKGGSPAAEKATGKLIDNMLQSSKSAAMIVVEQKSKMLEDIIRTGKQNKETNVVLTRALEKDLGKIPQWAVHDNKAVESVMGRMATWWGQRDLRPNTLNSIGAAKATATVRGNALEKIYAPYSVEQRLESLRLAQGIGVPTSRAVEELATETRKIIENLVGQVAGGSVLLRSAVDMNMLNTWMRKYNVGFEFTKGVKKDVLGNMVNYSKGTDWVNSWKTADIKEDPKVFLFKFQQAMEQSTREKAVFTDLAERFGTRVPSKGGFRNQINSHPYLAGYYFTDDIAKQIPRLVKDWSSSAWSPKSPLLQHYDRVLSMWKSGVTIYRPAHHIRNMMGDVFLGWMDGVNSLRPYQLAVKVQRSMKGAYETLQDIDNLVELGLASKSLATPKSGDILFRNKSGVAFTAEQIAAVAHQKGLLEHVSTLEDIIDMGVTGAKRNALDVKPFGGKVQKVARGASELQAHNARLAHFIDKVMKSRGDNIAEIFEAASRRARKWHPSGLDLTDFERKYLRRIIPFYSWMRKSMPLLAEGLVMNPGKVVVPAKIGDAVQDYQGIEQTDGRFDPFPVDQMFPEWLRAEGMGPIEAPGGILGSFSNESPPGYTMAGMGINPLATLMADLQNPGKTLLTSLTPAIQIPMELATGTRLTTGQAITGDEAKPGALSEYIGQNIPIWSALQGISGITPTGSLTNREMTSDGNTEALINFFTGAGLKGTGPYIDQGQYEFFAPGRSNKRAGREELMRKLREG